MAIWLSTIDEITDDLLMLDDLDQQSVVSIISEWNRYPINRFSLVYQPGGEIIYSKGTVFQFFVMYY